MSSSNNPAGFPDVQAKLQKPSKLSAFEKQKADAEAKRQREEAETAAAYEDFIKDFNHGQYDDERDPRHNMHGGGRNTGHGGPHRAGFGSGTLPGGPSKRHFGTTGLKSGPGSLGPPPSSFGKKRSFNDFSRGSREKSHAGHEGPTGGHSITKAFDTSDDEELGNVIDRAEEKAIARPTLRLQNLPLGTSPSVIRALMPKNLAVEDVKIQPPASQGSSERKALTAIVTLSQETPANDIDAAVSSLQNRYLGYGHYLSLHRHLSSAVNSSVAMPHAGLSTADSQPFGAKPVESVAEKERPRQQGFNRGFAPPSSYNQAAGDVNRSKLLHVSVERPKDIKTIRLINMVIEGVLEHGPEFEALLMSRPSVQREERWAWIWDARSEGATWYRWNLWEIVTGGRDGQGKGKFVPLFDGSHAWKAPEKRLPFEHSLELDEFASDSDYNSSDDEDIEGEANRENQGDETEEVFLNPFDKARLCHLLARLPTSLAKVRNGDIARVTAFAMLHTSRGVEEVVNMIVSNIEKPLALSSANPDRKQETSNGAPGVTADEAVSAETNDSSVASLITLYAVNDILASSSSTSGVRHAWRFRQLFETAMREHKTFEYLGSMAEKLRWGRMRAEKWNRSIMLVLNTWEGWCVFPAESHEQFVRTFESPPGILKEESKAVDPAKKSKWKVVEATQSEEPITVANEAATLPVSTEPEGEPINDEDDVAGEPIDDDDDDVAGEPIEEDDDVVGEPVEDDDVEGEPMEEDSTNGDDHMDEAGSNGGNMAQATEEAKKTKNQDSADAKANATEPRANAVLARKPRMRAVDMFADSDESDKGY